MHMRIKNLPFICIDLYALMCSSNTYVQMYVCLFCLRLAKKKKKSKQTAKCFKEIKKFTMRFP